MQRLFSNFANGWPGKGLMILRLAVSTFLMRDFLALFTGAASNRSILLSIVESLAGMLLLVGLWTPVAAVFVTALECWIAFSGQGEFWLSMMTAAIALSLALLGPGAWSADALAYGRKRISIHGR